MKLQHLQHNIYYVSILFWKQRCAFPLQQSIYMNNDILK